MAIYRKQAKYMRRGLRLTRQAAETASRQTKILEAGQRPWIMFQVDVWSEPDPSSGFGGVMRWSFLNVGHSPAFLTEFFVVSTVFTYPLPDKRPDDQTLSKQSIIIPPNGKHSSSLQTVVDAGMLRRIFDGTQCQVVYGIVRYDDSMGNHHLTRFAVLRHREDAEGWKQEPVGLPNWIEYT